MTITDTQKSIADRILEAMGASDAADETLEEAKKQHAHSAATGTRALAGVFAGINEDLSDKDVLAIADAVARAKARSGKGRVYSARKAETRVMLEQRGHVSAVIDRIDAEVDSRGADDKKVNIRLAMLTALRRLRDKTADTPDEAVGLYMAKLDKAPATLSDADRCARAIKTLTGLDALVQDAETKEKVLTVTQALEQAVAGHTEALDELVGGHTTPATGDDTSDAPHVAEGHAGARTKQPDPADLALEMAGITIEEYEPEPETDLEPILVEDVRSEVRSEDVGAGDSQQEQTEDEQT